MKVALIGYGKMGKTIEKIAQSGAMGDIEIALIIDEHNRNTTTIEELQKVDVAIDFTMPEVAVSNIMWCFEANVPIVVGTTGWTKDLKKIQEIAFEQEKAFLFAPNFSIGVNIFFEISRKLAEIMNQHPSYDVHMEEIHHTEKKDAPSGTAIHAAYDIIKRLSRKDKWKNEPSDNKATLPIISLREPHVPGTHTITYVNEIDQIELKHTAFTRDGFASGALLAAKWLKDKKGAYSMEDVLGFSSNI